MSLTYQSLLLDLEGSRSQLRGVTLPSKDHELVDWIRERRELEVRAADAACEEFALSLRWPSMQVDTVAAQVHLRVGAAIALCRHLSHRPVPAGVSRRDVLRSLLLEYWHERTAKLLRWVQSPEHDNPSGSPGRPPAPEAPGPAPGFNLTVV